MVITTEELLTTRELAEKLKVSLETIRRWKLQGMPCIELSKVNTRYQFSEVVKWRVGYVQSEKKT